MPLSQEAQEQVRIGNMIRSADKFFIDNDADEFGTQFLLSHSLTDEQQKALDPDRENATDYSEDGEDDNVFINVDASAVAQIRAKLIEWGFAEKH